MGGRGTFAAGNPVSYVYEVDTDFSPDGKLFGVKVLRGIKGTGKHGLPESSHSSSAYIKLDKNGVFREMRFYDENHVLYMEIAYHKEKKLAGNNSEPVLHYHLYDSRFSKNKSGSFGRTDAAYLTEEMKQKYGKYFLGVKNI